MVLMIDNQLILTDKGFKLMQDLQPNKDYLVTKSGKLVKFIGYGDVCNVEYLVSLSTGENVYLSGDTIIDADSHTPIKYLDVDMLNNMTNVPIKNISYVDLKSRHKVGFSRNECYDIGFKRNFDKLEVINFTLLSFAQRKEFIAGLIDNGETIVETNNISIFDIPNNIINIIIFIIRSLGFDATRVNNDLYMKPNTHIGLLPVKSIAKRQNLMCVMNTSNAQTVTRIKRVEECPIKVGQVLLVDTNEPILIGYSLLPIVQKR
jgi:hypothetical protein